ncbi:MAG: hypothetical protein R6U00_03685 [Prochlorococcaceae cyanobacterium]
MISASLVSDVMVCLLLQASLVTGAQVLERWIIPEAPCCVQPLVP